MSRTERMRRWQRQGSVIAAIGLVAVTAGCTRETKHSSSSTATATTAVTAAVTAAAAVSAAPASAAANHSNETYYWISQDSTLPLFVQHDYVGWKLAAKELGVQAKMVGPTTVDLPAFISTIEQVCAQHPAGVSVVGWDPSETAAVNQCMAEGVPTVTDDADLPNSNRISFIGTNWYDIGFDQAQQMAKVVPKGGKVATLSIIAADNMILARQGFVAGLAGTGIQIVANEDDAGDAIKAATKTASLLAAYPDLAGIAGFDAESGTGIVTALQEGGKTGKVKVTTVEQTPEFFKNLQTGTVSAIVVQKRELFTYYALKTLFDYNHSGLTVTGLSKTISSPVPLNIDTGLIVATKDNVADILKADNVS